MKYKGRTGEFFEIGQIDQNSAHVFREAPSDTLRLLWFTSDNNTLVIDGLEYHFKANDIVFLTQFHQVDFKQLHGVEFLQFNPPFYCILNHDSEVGCKGILYYGSAQPPIIMPNEMDLEVLKAVWKMAELEFNMDDNLQLEMLQMMLKRLLILCTRIYKRQHSLSELANPQNDLVREFNYLVESHFRTKHSVAEYAELLFKSPKTISNVFKKIGDKTPLQTIQERITLEARRLLSYTDKDVSEIAYELGFKDLPTFSRFFKKIEGDSPSVFREHFVEGSIAKP